MERCFSPVHIPKGGWPPLLTLANSSAFSLPLKFSQDFTDLSIFRLKDPESSILQTSTSGNFPGKEESQPIFSFPRASQASLFCGQEWYQYHENHSGVISSRGEYAMSSPPLTRLFLLGLVGIGYEIINPATNYNHRRLPAMRMVVYNQLLILTEEI